jgi:ankyrin repeat protein
MARGEEHLRYRDIVAVGKFEEAESYRVANNLELKNVCNLANKHCTTQPLYAALSAILYNGDSAVPGALAYMERVLNEVPELIDVINYRINPLSYTALNMDRPEVAKFFIDHKPEYMNDLSHYDANNQSSEFSKTFKMYKPSMNSPVHLAAGYNHPKTLELLLESGANPNLKNIAGITPLDMYLYNCAYIDDKVGELLGEHGATLTSNGWSTPSLYSAIQSKCWSDLNRVLPEIDTKMGDYYFNTLAKFLMTKSILKQLILFILHLTMYQTDSTSQGSHQNFVVQ